MGTFIISTMQEEEDPSCIALVYVHFAQQCMVIALLGISCVRTTGTVI